MGRYLIFPVGTSQNGPIDLTDPMLGKYIRSWLFVQRRAGESEFSYEKSYGRNEAVGAFWDFLMTALGLSMIVGGLAFLLSGMIFLLPTGRRQSAQDRSFEESQDDLEFYLSQMRKKPE